MSIPLIAALTGLLGIGVLLLGLFVKPNVPSGKPRAIIFGIIAIIGAIVIFIRYFSGGYR